MFKGFKEFTYKMVAGANVATIVIMLLVGFSDCLAAGEVCRIVLMLGLLFPVFLLVNLGFLALLVALPVQVCHYSIFGLSGMFCSCSQVYAHQC